MQFYPLMRTSFVCWTPHPLDETRRHLRESLDTGILQGSLVGDHLHATRPKGGRNSWRPRIHAKLSAFSGGTLVEATLSVHPLVTVFTLVHGTFFLGLTWLMGAAAFSWEAGPAIEALQGSVGATLVGDQQLSTLPVSDPSRPGAESHGPRLLQTSVSEEGVVFSVPQRYSLYGYGPLVRTEIRVGRQGVHVGGALVPWSELARSDLADEPDGQVLLLSGLGDQPPVRVPCDGLPREDALWLAAYLDAQIRRFELPPEEKLRQETERARLEQLVGGVRQ